MLVKGRCCLHGLPGIIRACGVRDVYHIYRVAFPEGCNHYRDVKWGSWCLKSSSNRVFFQELIQVYTNEIIKLLHYWPFVGESLGYRYRGQWAYLRVYTGICIDWNKTFGVYLGSYKACRLYSTTFNIDLSTNTAYDGTHNSPRGI